MKLPKLNKVVIYLSLSDVFTWGPYTIISMLTGLYLASKLGENVVQFVGIGTSIYFFTRALFQMPVGILTDKYKHDKDEILILFVGILLMGFPFLLYPYIQNQYQYFFLQFLFGLGVSLNLTNWRKLFALNVDTGREGRQYSMYEVIMSVSTALICILGGYIANMGDIYFDTVMSVAGVIIMLGGIWSIMIYRYEGRKSRKKK
ncbi:hypothetical protein CVU76_02520 [Candidatus Dojkabacteria bacterium HGW-Dojkabacteria-1]|uniref:Major facilitator superfamily (MFS) profile domain-containing protein n=1 Tax=Candidatus Dojkabacteria bacterium HGW-Dojkabacteria-1 TaxID=2013761 RepID=A0A2N2F3Z9_9BACT|nr:MAG: hypothetical protein CVU76_02520 [Candidatus Dojkabacteria bacterium HGW-Dojkabacteria-1]